MIDEKTKVVLDICDIKSDMVKSMINKATNGKESREEIEKFINYLNAIVKTNKSKNNLNNRILCLYNSIKDISYTTLFKKLNIIFEDMENNNLEIAFEKVKLLIDKDDMSLYERVS